MMVLLLAYLVSDSESEGESEASTTKQQEVTPAKTRTCTGNSRAKGVRQPSAKGVCYFPVLVCAVC